MHQTNQPSKFRTKIWVKLNVWNVQQLNLVKLDLKLRFRFKTTLLKSNTAAEKNDNKKLTFKNYALFMIV